LQFRRILFFIKANLYQNRTQVYAGDTQTLNGESSKNPGEGNWHPQIFRATCKRAFLVNKTQQNYSCYRRMSSQNWL